jgi:hypothetical protein
MPNRMEGACSSEDSGMIISEENALWVEISSLYENSSFVIVGFITQSIACVDVCVLPGSDPRGVLELPISEL